VKVSHIEEKECESTVLRMMFGPERENVMELEKLA
jgi:hypothetical protein